MGCVSCSDRNKSNNGINIFRPTSDRLDQYNRTSRGATKLEIGEVSKSMQRRRYDQDNEVLFGYLTVVIGVIGLVFLGFLFERYLVYRMKISVDGPMALFVELCVAHQLTRMERNLLELVAETTDISDPLPIFMDPKYLIAASDNNKFKDVKQIIEYLLIKLFESKPDSSITKRSSILLQSEKDSNPKNETESDIISDILNSTIAYQTPLNNNDNDNDNDNSPNQTPKKPISEQTTIIAPE
jgi:hypothetical protein